jgi:hypothetical protein
MSSDAPSPNEPLAMKSADASCRTSDAQLIASGWISSRIAVRVTGPTTQRPYSIAYFERRGLPPAFSTRALRGRPRSAVLTANATRASDKPATMRTGPHRGAGASHS